MTERTPETADGDAKEALAGLMAYFEKRYAADISRLAASLAVEGGLARIWFDEEADAFRFERVG